jgi:tape measure domain-containing protein
MAKNADIELVVKARNDAKSALSGLANDLKSLGVGLRTVNTQLGSVDKAVDKLATTTGKLSSGMAELGNATKGIGLAARQITSLVLSLTKLDAASQRGVFDTLYGQVTKLNNALSQDSGHITTYSQKMDGLSVAMRGVVASAKEANTALAAVSATNSRLSPVAAATLIRRGPNVASPIPVSSFTGQSASAINSSARLAQAEVRQTTSLATGRAGGAARAFNPDELRAAAKGLEDLDKIVLAVTRDAQELYKQPIGPKVPRDIAKAYRDQNKAEREIADATARARQQAENQNNQGDGKFRNDFFKAVSEDRKRDLADLRTYYAAQRDNASKDLTDKKTYFAALKENYARDQQYLNAYYAATREDAIRANRERSTLYNKPIGPQIPKDVAKASRDQAKAEQDIAQAAARAQQAAEVQNTLRDNKFRNDYFKAVSEDRKRDIADLKTYYAAKRDNERLDSAAEKARIAADRENYARDLQYVNSYYAALREAAIRANREKKALDKAQKDAFQGPKAIAYGPQIPNDNRGVEILRKQRAALKAQEAAEKPLPLRPPDTRDFESALTRAKGSLLSFQNIARTVAGAVGGYFAIKSVFSLTDSFTGLQSQLRLVTRDTENLNEVYEKLSQIANNTRQGLEPTVTTYSRIAKATKNLEVSQRDVLEVTENITKAVAIFQGPAASAEAALYQLGQALASNRLGGDEFRSVAEQAPRLAQAIADGIGVSLGKLKEMGAAGELTTKVVFKALQSQSKILSQEFAKVAVTVGQSITVLKNNLLNFVGSIDQTSGGSKRLAQAILDLAVVFNDPGFIRAATTAFEGLIRALILAAQGFQLLVENGRIVAGILAAIGAGLIIRTFATLAALCVEVATGLGLVGAAVATVGTEAAVAAPLVSRFGITLASLGGPVGLALAIATGAIVYFATKTSDADVEADKLRETLKTVKDAVKEAGGEAKNLSDEFKKIQLKTLEDQAKRVKVTLTDTLKDLNGYLDTYTKQANTKVFGLVNIAPIPSDVLDKLKEFSAAIKNGEFNIIEFRQYMDELANDTKSSDYIKSLAKSFLEVTKSGETSARSLKEITEVVKILNGEVKAAESSLRGFKGTLDVISERSADGLREDIEAINKSLRDGVPYLAEQDKKLKDAKAAAQQYKEELELIDKLAQRPGVTQEEVAKARATAAENYRKNIEYNSGLYESIKKMKDLQKEANESAFTGREKEIQKIKDDYDDLAKKIKETTTSPEAKNTALAELQALTQTRLNNLDVEYNKGFQQKLRNMQDEATLIGKVGEARERAAALLQVEQDARDRYGEKTPEAIAKIKEYVDAYASAYDKLKSLSDANQTIGQGFKQAVTKYVEETNKVADESEKLFTGVFTSLEDHLTEFITKGKTDWKSMLDSWYNDLIKFAVRGSLNSILGSLFGDGKTNGDSGAGGLLGNLLQSALGGSGSKAGTTAGKTSGATNSANNGGVIGSFFNSILGEKNAGILNPFKTGSTQSVAQATTSAAATAQEVINTPAGKLALAEITTSTGLVAKVNAQYASNFQGLINDLEGQGYKINSLGEGGFSFRNVAGTGNLSNHALGNALDINPRQNPQSPYTGAPVVTDFPDNIRELAAKNGLRYGGDFRRPDPMHFDIPKNGVIPVDKSELEDITKSAKDIKSTTEGFGEDLKTTFDTGAGDTSAIIKDWNSDLKSTFQSSTDTLKDSLSGLGKGGNSGSGSGGTGSTFGLGSNTDYSNGLTAANTADFGGYKADLSSYENMTFDTSAVDNATQQYANDLGQTFEKNTQDLGGTLSGATSGIGGIFGSLLSGVGSIFSGFAGGLGGILKSALNIIQQLFSAFGSGGKSGGGSGGGGGLADLLGKGISSAFNAFGFGGGPEALTAAATADFGGYAEDLSWLTTLTFHKGGHVGTGGEPGIHSAALFKNAPRFHKGMGLKKDEIPAILQRDEVVLTRDQARGLAENASRARAKRAGDVQPILEKGNTSSLTPLSVASGLANTYGNPNVTVNQTIVAPDPNQFRQTLSQQANATRQAMERATRRDG